MTARVADAEPIATINITPLIDVMLVLLIMMILTIPTVTHKVSVDLPTNGPTKSAPPEKMHRLDIAASGALMLDGVVTDEAGLSDRLVPIVADKEALLTVNADAESRYDVFDHVLATIKRVVGQFELSRGYGVFVSLSDRSQRNIHS